jgi:hypothetical protein
VKAGAGLGVVVVREVAAGLEVRDPALDQVAVRGGAGVGVGAVAGVAAEAEVGAVAGAEVEAGVGVDREVGAVGAGVGAEAGAVVEVEVGVEVRKGRNQVMNEIQKGETKLARNVRRRIN